MTPNSQKILTQARLKELLYYDPDTGIFTWRVARGRQPSGNVAGTVRPDGRVQISLDHMRYFAHRLAVLYMTGVWPEADVDHKNGDPSYNCWLNLRCVSHQINQHNFGAAHSDNECGLIGASLDKRCNKWYARIHVDGKTKFLGYHPTAEAAHGAYLKAKDELHPTHLRLRAAA